MGTITFKSQCTNEEIIEGSLNLYYSGYDYRLPLIIHLMAKNGNIEMLFFVQDLIKQRADKT